MKTTKQATTKPSDLKTLARRLRSELQNKFHQVPVDFQDLNSACRTGVLEDVIYLNNQVYFLVLAGNGTNQVPLDRVILP